MVGARRRRRSPSGSARRRAARSTATRRRDRRAGRASSWPTRSSSSAIEPRDRRAAPHRRGPDARLVAVLGRRDYEPGRAQASFDKQFVRDWLETPGLGQDARPARSCPAEVVAGTRARYVEAFERITGASFERYLDGGRRSPDEHGLPVRRQRHARSPGSSIRRAGRSRAASATSAIDGVQRRPRRPAGRADGRRRRRGGGAGDRRAAGRASCCRTR